MSRTFSIDLTRKLVISTYTGVLTLDDVYAQWREIRAHRNYDASYDYLTDLSSLEEYRINPADTRILSQTPDPFGPDSLRVVVAPSDQTFGMTRLYEMSGKEHPNLIVVRSMDEAQRVFSSRRPSH